MTARILDRLGEDDGTAVLEFVLVGVLVMAPLFYLVAAMAQLQAGAYATAGAAREAGRMFVTARDDASAHVRADAGAALVFADHRVEGDVAVACARNPCLTRGAAVTLTTTSRVRLPLVPDFLDGVVPTTVQVQSTHVEHVGRYRP